MAALTKIQVRRGTASSWTSTNPTLAAGEFGFETDTGKLKCGDGSTTWTSLGYINSAGTTTPVPAVKWASGAVYRNGITANAAGTLTSGTTYYVPIYVPNSVTISEMGFLTTASWSGTGVARLGIYNDTNGKPDTVLLDAGLTGNITTTNTFVSKTGLSQSLSQGMYWLAINITTAPTTASIIWANTGNAYLGSPSSTSSTTAFNGISYYVTSSPVGGASGGFVTATSPAWVTPSTTANAPVIYVRTA